MWVRSLQKIFVGVRRVWLRLWLLRWSQFILIQPLTITAAQQSLRIFSWWGTLSNIENTNMNILVKTIILMKFKCRGSSSYNQNIYKDKRCDQYQYLCLRCHYLFYPGQCGQCIKYYFSMHSYICIVCWEVIYLK